VLTPPLSSSILPGITRDSVIQICQELGITIKERTIQRAALYVADELFFTGTAAEVTPIRSVDRIQVGNGGRGPVTEKIQTLFFEITKGERPAPGDWLTYVNQKKKAPSSPDGFARRSLETATEDTAPILFQAAARD
jgi:branched-chain amino acid aminotransferase